MGLLHRGGILLEKDIDDMKLNIHKLQCVIKEEEMLDRIKNELEVVTLDNRGSFYTITVRVNSDMIVEFIENLNPVFY